MQIYDGNLLHILEPMTRKTRARARVGGRRGSSRGFSRIIASDSAVPIQKQGDRSPKKSPMIGTRAGLEKQTGRGRTTRKEKSRCESERMDEAGNNAESTIRNPITARDEASSARRRAESTDSAWRKGAWTKSRIKIGIKRYYPPS